MRTLTRDDLKDALPFLDPSGVLGKRFPSGHEALYDRALDGYRPRIMGGSPALASRAADEEELNMGATVPFVRASIDFFEQMFQQANVTPGANATDAGPYNVTPGGFLRGLLLTVTGTGGVIGTATLAADYPFTLLSYIVLEDVNGQPIFGPLTGYETFLVNKYGGYFFWGNPVTVESYVGTINADFSLWIPCEFRSDGLGSLANTDARAQYRLRYGIATAISNTGSTAWTTAPTLTITGHRFIWTQVDPTSLDGVPQDPEPPGLGTTQFWVHESPVVAASQQVVRLNRVGNLIRNLIFVTRTDDAQAAAVQATPRAQMFDDPVRVRLDNIYLRVAAVRAWRHHQARQYGLTTFGDARDVGVLTIARSGSASGRPGPDEESNYLPTTEATYAAIEATFNDAGTLNILTNDIAPYGQFAMPDELG